MITKELKVKVVEALKVSKANFTGSDAKFAVSIDINAAQLSRILSGDIEQVLSDAKWISLARLLDVNARGEAKWNIVATPVFLKIRTQLQFCQKNSVAGIFCDQTDIGKTVAAREYSKSNKGAVYIDCSQTKTKQKLVRKIAQEFGVGHTGKYASVYDDVVFYINTLATARPIIILDEAGDLQYDAFLEIKALWNATEGSCGWYMIGADGLREKMRRAIDNLKVGYSEIFRRFGKRYQYAVPQGKEEAEKFNIEQAALIIQGNAPKGTDVQKMLRKTDGSLTRIFIEISKKAS